MIDLIVCICSRGLIHSRTMESIDRNLTQTELSWDRLYTHDLPIPDAQNDVVERALALKPTYLWFVEEDIVVPNGILVKLLAAARSGVSIVVAGYRLKGGSDSWCLSQSGKLLYAGIGCMLANPSSLPLPWFCADQLWTVTQDGDGAFVSAGKSKPNEYGKQDVDFFARLWKAGIESVLLADRVRHVYVAEKGKPHANDGCHKILDY